MINPKYNLIYSSSLFSIPCIYGIYKGKYFLSTCSFISMTASINYWINPITGPIKTIDLYTSKICGLIYFINGYIDIKNELTRILGYTNGIFILSAFNTSCILHFMNSDSWEIYHVLFHVFTVIGKMIVLSI